MKLRKLLGRKRAVTMEFKRAMNANEYLQVKSISFDKRNIRAISHYQEDLE
jgi:hypothetical protein